MNEIQCVVETLLEELTFKLSKNKEFEKNEVDFFTSLKKLKEIIGENEEGQKILENLTIVSLKNETISNKMICQNSLLYGISFCNRIKQFNTTYF